MQVRLLKKGHPNVTIFILGGTGSGKTTLVANLVQHRERWILFDTREEYDPYFFKGQNITIVYDIDGLCYALNEQRNKIMVKLPMNVEQDEYLSAALGCIYQFQTANAKNDKLPPVLIVIDELNRFADTNNWPPALREMIQRGRDFKIDRLFGAQWFNTIPTWCRDSFSEIYAFRHTDKNGLSMLERFGFEPDDVKNLPAYTCLHTGKNGIVQIRLVAVGGNAEKTTKTA
jgi:hypothetical protein